MRMFGAIWLALVLAACSTAGYDQHDPGSAITAHQIYLVRHAEKQAGDNPSLTEQGQMRAELLADLLADRRISQIHSTNYRRTLETAAPLADRLGLQVQLYDPSDLDAFARDLAARPGVHLVVGHSNTTPQLAAALGGDPGTEIDETSEYDRLYVLTLRPGAVDSRIERFGERYDADAGTGAE